MYQKKTLTFSFLKSFLVMSLFIFSHSSNAYYLDLGIGAGGKSLGGNQDYTGAALLSSEVSLGHKFEKWDISLDGLFQISRQSDFTYSYDNNTFTDDYTWAQWHIGPTFKYHMKRGDGKGTWAPFLGLHYTQADLDNSANLRSPTTGYDEDGDHELWGYGAKVGVQFTSPSNSSVIENVNYKFFVTHTRFRNMQGSYFNNNGEIAGFDGDPTDDLTDTTVNFMVSFSFGDKILQKIKNKIN